MSSNLKLVESVYTEPGYYHSTIAYAHQGNGSFLLMTEAITAIGTCPHLVSLLTDTIFRGAFPGRVLPNEPNSWSTREVGIVFIQRLQTACEKADAAVLSIKQILPLREFESSCVTCTYIYGNNAYIGHIGRCRAYLVHKNQIIQITNDHVNERNKSLVVRAFGNPLAVEPSPPKDIVMDFLIQPIEPGDWIFLCSWRVHFELSDTDLLDIIGKSDTPETAIQLVAQSLTGYSTEGFSLIAAQIL